MNSRGARAARGVAVAAFATFVASLAHTGGGGAAPGPVAVLVALAFSAPLAMLLAGARARIVRTAISALVAQAALHLCYALGGGPAVAAAASPHAGHGTAVHLDDVLAAPVVDNGHALMPAAHVLAAAITVAALALGDDVFDELRRSVRMLVRRLTTMAAPAFVIPFRVEPLVERPRLVSGRLVAALGSRAPPLAVVAS